MCEREREKGGNTCERKGVRGGWWKERELVVDKGTGNGQGGFEKNPKVVRVQFRDKVMGVWLRWFGRYKGI